MDANKLRAGDKVYAKTTQVVLLSNGAAFPPGSKILGHVVRTDPFVSDKVTDAKQKVSTLSVRFDSIVDRGHQIPLSVYVRALADPFNTWDARKPRPTDEDSLGTMTQVGGDQVTPSQNEVLSYEGKIVGSNRRRGVYARLLPSTGNSPESCDGTITEQSMGIFSASACGLYGFPDTMLQQAGRKVDPGTIVLTSTSHAPQIYANSSALLEVSPRSTVLVPR